MSDAHRKVSAGHLSRDAYLYVRQSTVRQVVENTESTRRQYALRERAVALGWPTERVVVIDTDLGQSGADQDREGFQHLVAEVGMGRAGIVLGLEVSRLARNSTDWHRLLEICALSDTLILDEDGVYNPGDFNDRLLLGLKGTMSEAELHMLHARLRGGMLNQARRGALKLPLPVGLLYDPLDRVVLDPDAQVQQSLRMLFDTFELTGSAAATVRHFRERRLHFPRRLRTGSRKGELHWQPLEHSRVLQVLHNPRYAGAYAFGRSRQRRLPGGGVESRRLPLEEWTVLLRNAHPGYIGWERFEANRRRLRSNALAHGADRRRGPPREGPALLQGLVVCGVCGQSMTVRYHSRRGRRVPDYVCQRESIRTASAKCQSIPGAGLEAEWNARLRALDDARQELEQQRAQDPGQPDDAQRQRILALSTDFPRLWNDPATPARERKRMARLLIEDVTLTRGTDIALGIRLRGGATRQLQLPPEPPAWQLYRTSEHIMAEIDRLTDNHTDTQIAAILNDLGLRTGRGVAFRPQRIQALRRAYGLKTRYQRLRAQGLLSLTEIAARLEVSTRTVKIWRSHGLLRAHPYNDRNQCLYEPPIGHPPSKQQGRKLATRQPIPPTPVSTSQQGAV